MDVIQTDMVTTISNITQTFNEFQKFPEMDAYTISKIYADWTALGKTASTTALTVDNILEEFDKMMLAMDNARVPANGRVLYVTNEINYTIKQAIARQYQNNQPAIGRAVSRIDEVEIIPVPATLMKSVYDFTQGWKVGTGAAQINMMLVLPEVVLTPVSYTFAQLEAPSALSEGKYVYYEESFEDVFILNQRADGVQFNVTAGA